MQLLKQGDMMDQLTKNRALDAVWDAIDAHLQDIKRAATQEIRNYPQPIAGCDAQIPALWETRDGAVTELERLAGARQKATVDAGNAIDAFLATSRYIDDDTKRRFRALAAPGMPSAAE